MTTPKWMKIVGRQVLYPRADPVKYTNAPRMLRVVRVLEGTELIVVEVEKVENISPAQPGETVIDFPFFIQVKQYNQILKELAEGNYTLAQELFGGPA